MTTFFERKIDIPKGEIDTLSVGEILIDMISNDYSQFNGAVYKRCFGGSPGNLSINMSKLGYKSSIVGNVGNDNFGEFLIKRLEENKVDTRGVTIDSTSNTSIVIVTKSKDSPSFIAYREADKKIKFNNTVEKLVKASKIIHFTSWPISHEPARSAVLKILNIGIKNNKIISFDPNYRRVLWERNHDGVKFIKEILKKVCITKPSLDDCKSIFGEGTQQKYIEKFINLGVNIVMLTLGKDGVIVSNGKEIRKFDSLATEVVDTTGAGDAFWSGFYSGILRKKTIEQSVKVGSAVSAYKLKHVGAITDLPKVDKIMSLI